jgi:hypothetical protein
MRRLLPLVLPFALHLGCEPTSTGTPVPTPTGDTGETGTAPSPIPLPAGVQVGSEGLIPSDCETAPVADPSDRLEELDLLRDHLERTLRAQDVRLGEGDGTLALQGREWLSVGGRCPESLIGRVQGPLALPALEADLTGWIAVGRDGVVTAALATSTFSGSREPTGLPPGLPVVLRAEGTLEPTLALALAFEACDAESDCSTDPIDTLARR